MKIDLTHNELKELAKWLEFQPAPYDQPNISSAVRKIIQVADNLNITYTKEDATGYSGTDTITNSGSGSTIGGLGD